MSSSYEKVRGGRLAFKGGELATREKPIDKKNKKKKKSKKKEDDDVVLVSDSNLVLESEAYTIDAAKKMKYEDLFPVETKKFGYDPKLKAKSIEDALDDRVKKKADRYCK